MARHLGSMIAVIHRGASRLGLPAMAKNMDNKRALAEAGVTRILNPFDDAADHAAARLTSDIRQQEKTS